MKNVACVILAAGKGERMKSELPKVMHPICSRPMLGYVLDLVKELKINRASVVLGHKHEVVKKLLGPGYKTVIQKKILGTADAVKQAMPSLRGFKGTVLVLYGDIPLLKAQTLNKLLKRHQENSAFATLLTAKVNKPAGYGRVLRDKYTSACGIIEDKDANDAQKDIKEINTGIICFDKAKLESALKRIKPNNRKKEYYLTDAINILYKNGGLIESLVMEDADEAMGINSRVELAKANKIMRSRINEELMKQGVSIVDPDSAFISFGTKIGKDTVIYPFTVIEKNVKIGKSCEVGPFVHLRENTALEDNVTLGNFIELARSSVGSKSFIKHFGYIGDTRIGRGVNIGAGTVTANFDGVKKNNTFIADEAFIGSDTVLIAPVKVGKAAKTGAGSIVLSGKNVPAGITVAGVPAKPLIRK
jgi:bifunctional UDP-N-acetylglucosamine pyrophosphorylase/glucosamine-1-phosphate N-acetyltransferase